MRWLKQNSLKYLYLYSFLIIESVINKNETAKTEKPTRDECQTRIASTLQALDVSRGPLEHSKLLYKPTSDYLGLFLWSWYLFAHLGLYVRGYYSSLFMLFHWSLSRWTRNFTKCRNFRFWKRSVVKFKNVTQEAGFR